MQTFLFDLDDTILAYDAVAGKAWQEACETYINHFSVSVAELRSAILETSRWYWSDTARHKTGRMNLKQARRDVIAKTLRDMNLQSIGQIPISEEIGNSIADFFSARREELVHPFPGAIETLQTFKDRGYGMALLTNGAAETQRNKIDRFDLEHFFKIILVEGELGFGKPDARVYNMALEHLGAEPQDAMMIGDNLEWDIKGAQALGIKGIWNDWQKTGLPKDAPAKPDRIISNISELREPIA